MGFSVYLLIVEQDMMMGLSLNASLLHSSNTTNQEQGIEPHSSRCACHKWVVHVHAEGRLVWAPDPSQIFSPPH